MTDKIIFEMAGPKIGHLTINNPAKRNALSSDMWTALPALLDKAAATPSLRVLIVRGTGDHFASGADISEFSELYATPQSSAKNSAQISDGLNALAAFPLPTIASIRGACVGGGCGVALACDIRFADSTSKFAITPAKMGLTYPYDDVVRLIDAVGLPHAKDMLYSARTFKAKKAKKIGLVNDVLPVDELDEFASNYAQSIAGLSSLSVASHKAIFHAYQSGLRSPSEAQIRDFAGAFGNADFKEGFTAFLEKRRAKFD